MFLMSSYFLFLFWNCALVFHFLLFSSSCVFFHCFSVPSLTGVFPSSLHLYPIALLVCVSVCLCVCRSVCSPPCPCQFVPSSSFLFFRVSPWCHPVFSTSIFSSDFAPCCFCCKRVCFNFKIKGIFWHESNPWCNTLWHWVRPPLKRSSLPTGSLCRPHNNNTLQSTPPTRNCHQKATHSHK